MSITSSNTEEQAFFSSSIAFSKRWLCEERITENRNICWQLEYSEKMLISFWCGLFGFFFFWLCVCVCWVYLGWLIFLLVMFPSMEWLWLKQIRKKELKDHVVVCNQSLPSALDVASSVMLISLTTQFYSKCLFFFCKIYECTSENTFDKEIIHKFYLQCFAYLQLFKTMTILPDTFRIYQRLSGHVTKLLM